MRELLVMAASREILTNARALSEGAARALAKRRPKTRQGYDEGRLAARRSVLALLMGRLQCASYSIPRKLCQARSTSCWAL